MNQPQQGEPPNWVNYLAAILCVALGLFAFWLVLDSTLQIIHGRTPLAGEARVLAALPIGAGFEYAAWRILHPLPRSGQDRAAGAWLLAGLGLVLLIQAAAAYYRQEQLRTVMVSALGGFVFLWFGWTNWKTRSLFR